MHITNQLIIFHLILDAKFNYVLPFPLDLSSFFLILCFIKSETEYVSNQYFSAISLLLHM